MRILLVTLSILIMAGCGPTQRRDSVWDIYDLRHAPAAGVAGPNDPAYNTYIDNDSYYTPPSNNLTYWGE